MTGQERNRQSVEALFSSKEIKSGIKKDPYVYAEAMNKVYKYANKEITNQPIEIIKIIDDGKHSGFLTFQFKSGNNVYQMTYDYGFGGEKGEAIIKKVVGGQVQSSRRPIKSSIVEENIPKKIKWYNKIFTVEKSPNVRGYEMIKLTDKDGVYTTTSKEAFLKMLNDKGCEIIQSSCRPIINRYEVERMIIRSSYLVESDAEWIESAGKWKALALAGILALGMASPLAAKTKKVAQAEINPQQKIDMICDAMSERGDTTIYLWDEDGSLTEEGKALQKALGELGRDDGFGFGPGVKSIAIELANHGITLVNEDGKPILKADGGFSW